MSLCLFASFSVGTYHHSIRKEMNVFLLTFKSQIRHCFPCTSRLCSFRLSIFSASCAQTVQFVFFASESVSFPEGLSLGGLCTRAFSMICGTIGVAVVDAVTLMIAWGGAEVTGIEKTLLCVICW